MNRLCFLTNLTSAEWAAWFQALGSIAAIIGAAWIAIWQSRRQHESSLEIMREERRHTRNESALTLLALSTSCVRALDHVVQQFPDREAVHRVGAQDAHFDFNELCIIEGAVLSVPLHSLPHSLVPLAMIVNSTVRQFREKVESALRTYRQMNAAAFDDFFFTVTQMQGSLSVTCADIEAEVRRSSSEA